MGIKELIERGETQSVEFKESQRLKDEIGETVSAFSNSNEGVVLVGVSNSSSELRKLAKESGERVYYRLNPTYKGDIRGHKGTRNI